MATDGRKPLSTAALRVWTELQRSCILTPNCALTDRELSERIHLPQREIIDAAGELLGVGILCLAGEHGRWLGTTAEARAYEQSLGRRARAILHRRRLVRRAILLNQLGQVPDDNGQFPLFT